MYEMRLDQDQFWIESSWLGVITVILWIWKGWCVLQINLNSSQFHSALFLIPMLHSIFEGTLNSLKNAIVING